jgi:Domain of unknown function (DUF4193)
VDDVKDTMKDTDQPVEDDETAEEEDLEDVEPTEADLDEAVVPADPPEPVDPADPAAAEVESIQDLLVKQEARAEEEEADEEEDIAVPLTKDERLEPVETRVVPIQTTEFVCKGCFLVKQRSQLADKKRMLCRDCA